MRILFIGSINYLANPSGGEEFKNTLLVNKMKTLSHIKLNIIDTHNWRKNPIVIFKLLYYLLNNSSDKIILSASSKSVYRLLNLITFFRTKNLSKIIYIVVGGWFPNAIVDNVINPKNYIKLNSIIVQGKVMMEQLLAYDLRNITIIPNFKNFEHNLILRENKPNNFKFVFIGRISKFKGILEIVEASQILKQTNPSLNFQVDFYGPIEENIEFPENLPIAYKGYLDIMNNQVQSYEKLSEYYCMLFPTYWQGEGFPGVIIDAYVAGLPVIATDWNMNKEVVEDSETGLIIRIKDAHALASAMLKMMENPELVATMSLNSMNKAKDFHIDVVWPQIESLLTN